MTGLIEGLDEMALFGQIVREQLAMHDSIALQDWYKLAHQATLGGGHAGLDEGAVVRSIQKEWGRGERTVPGEKMLEIIDPMGRVMRVNIRLFEKSGGRVSVLAQAFMASWQAFQGEEATLLRLGEYLADLAHDMPGMDAAAIQNYWEEMQAQGFPAAHHSHAYRLANRPAYRIIQKQFWPPFQ